MQDVLLKPHAEHQNALKKAEEKIHYWNKKYKTFQIVKDSLPWYKAKLMKYKVGQWILNSSVLKALEPIFRGTSLEITQETTLYSLIRKLEKTLAEIVKEYNLIKDKLDDYDSTQQKWEMWKSENLNNPHVMPELLDQELDYFSLRHKAFYLATHYWEARWLLAMSHYHTNNASTSMDVEARLKTFAKLAPCFISTVFMLPNFFSKKKQPFYNLIDLLIVDEAGQVNSFQVAPSLALAKKAFIVGDIKQLDPIANIPMAIDIGNAIRYKVIDQEKEYEDTFIDSGLTALKGSLMNRAHALTSFKQCKYLPERGFFLKEHWRCVPKIANFCNTLAYNGALEPMRQEPEEALFPSFAYAHIRGTSVRDQGSLKNEEEAQLLVRWLHNNKEKLCSHYNNLNMGDIVGIVTPYKAQANLIKKKLRETKLFGITVGTVHAFQGGERPLILYSAVYGPDDPTNFVDGKVNFLNVSVSRAKDSFIVFGNMEVFKPNYSTPMSLLARSLFESRDNELGDLDFCLPQAPVYAQVRTLSTPEDHAEFLIHALRIAESKILISSPYISSNAIEKDTLTTHLKNCVDRNVYVAILTDHFFDRDKTNSSQNLKPSAEKGRELIISSGANLFELNNIHDKVICIDDHTFVLGSYNWFSAARKGRYKRVEQSVVCSHEVRLHSYIKSQWDRIENLSPVDESDFRTPVEDVKKRLKTP